MTEIMFDSFCNFWLIINKGAFFIPEVDYHFISLKTQKKDKLCLKEKEIKQKSSRKQNGAKNLLLITIKNQLSI